MKILTLFQTSNKKNPLTLGWGNQKCWNAYLFYSLFILQQENTHYEQLTANKDLDVVEYYTEQLSMSTTQVENKQSPYCLQWPWIQTEILNDFFNFPLGFIPNLWSRKGAILLSHSVCTLGIDRRYVFCDLSFHYSRL